MRVRVFVVATIVSAAFVLGLVGTPPQAAATIGHLTGACCFAHGSCLDGYHSGACANVGGSYQGDFSVCAQGLCQPVPCGESGSPVCGGTCPAGTRCIDTNNLQLTIILLVATGTDEEQGATTSCECVEVRCGGVPLENGQGCCNGTPFTIGLQGCCNGEIVPVDSECFCGSLRLAQEQINGPTIDLRERGCCELGFPVRATDPPTESGLFDTTFNVAEGGCCQRRLLGENFPEDPFVATEATYTFGTGLDCCPDGPIALPEELDVNLQEALDLAGLCAGTCFESECATQDCCRCEGCIEEIEGTCISAGSQSTCESLCSTFGCEGVTYVANAMCTEDGSCIPSATAAPAASSTGLVTLLLALMAIGGFAIVARRRLVQ